MSETEAEMARSCAFSLQISQVTVIKLFILNSTEHESFYPAH